MQYQQPEKIYARIRDLVDESIANVSELASSEIASEALSTKGDAALPLLRQYRDKVAARLDELAGLAEWEVFTIAMYGETNAGKSTVIETLRILLGESTKLEAQASFRKLRDAHAIAPERIEALERELQDWLAERSLREQEVGTLQDEQAADEARMQRQQHALASALQRKERDLSSWGKFVRRFRKLKEEVELAEHTLLLERSQQARASALKLVQARAADPAAHVRRCEQQLQAIRKALAEMAPYEDGAIIGDGRSDFTLQMQTYRFDLGGRKVDLLDVPGIEGHEQKVRAAISAAVKKAHAVVYITRKPGPPNKGEEGRPGTLEKIREHLGSQAEVWALYNKSIANPLAFPATGLLNEGESSSLQDLDRELRQQLGDSYQRCISLSAQPAFYAVADCLLPGNIHERNRHKFLATYDPRSLIEKSGFAGFVHLLQNEFCRDDGQIKRSNLRKIRVILEDGAEALQRIIRDLAAARDNLDTQWRSVCREIDALEGSVDGAMRSRCGDKLSGSRARVRKEIYDGIAKDIDNDAFQALVSSRIEQLKKDLVTDLQEALQEAFRAFEADVQGVVQRFHKKADEILRLNIDSRLRAGDDDLKLDFTMDSGIDTPRLLSSLGGAAALALGIFFASNPVGWVAAALGVLGILVGGFKSVAGWISSSYRMEQQRKSADENLQRTFDALEKRVKERIAEVVIEIARHLKDAKARLAAPLYGAKRNHDALEAVHAHMQHLAAQLSQTETQTA